MTVTYVINDIFIPLAKQAKKTQRDSDKQSNRLVEPLLVARWNLIRRYNCHYKERFIGSPGRLA